MEDFGIYTAADSNFFPGVVVHLESLRSHGYRGRLAVFDTGLEPWMRDYLVGRGADVVAMDFVKRIRFTDVKTDEHAGWRGWSFKAFGIAHARFFRRFTFIDADYIPLCNLQAELDERIGRGEFLCTEDGHNTWDQRHEEAVGVPRGTFMNINAGFFSASLDHFDWLIEEWRNLMTRRKPFDLWYGDQGALNAILDKYGISKSLIGHKADWNQTWLNESLARSGTIEIESLNPPILRHKGGNRVFGWHGCGWHRYWHAIGIDHYRSSEREILDIERESWLKVPDAVLNTFSSLLFRAQDLSIRNHRIEPVRQAAEVPSTGAAKVLQCELYDEGMAAAFGGLRRLPVKIALAENVAVSAWESFFEKPAIVRISGRELEAAATHSTFDIFVETRLTGQAVDLGLRAKWPDVIRSGGWQVTEVETGLHEIKGIEKLLPSGAKLFIGKSGVQDRVRSMIVRRKGW